MPKPRKQTAGGTTVVVTLDKPAKKSGGDRYVNEAGDFTPYVPQTISRPDGKNPVKTMTMVITTE